MAIFQNLPNYSWDAKVVITLAAFAVKYGEFCFITQLSTTNNHLAKSFSSLKQSLDITVHATALKSHIDKIKILLEAIENVTDLIFKLKEFFLQSIPYEMLATAKACFPLAAYWTIQSMVACSSQITIFLGMCFGHITPSTEVLEVSSLIHKLTNIQSELEIIHNRIEEEGRYQFLKSLFKMVHVDNMKILKALINLRDDKKPLLDLCSKPRRTNKTRVSIEQVLLKKTVVLLISDLDIVEEEFFTIKQFYLETKKRSDLPYEIVWIPVVDNSMPTDEASRKKFEQVQAWMQWYIVADPWLLDPVVIRYMKEVWQFSKKQMLVVLDSKGVVVNNNALHMFRIWGNVAFPFTAAKEESLWMRESWKLELLVKTVDQTIVDWNSQGKVICLYGGIDMEWIREFTSVAKGVTMEMVYVGNSKAKERVKNITTKITEENLSRYCLPDLARIWCFWTRFESMWYSKTQYGKTVENDNILREVSTMLSFGESYQGWATISKGSDMVTANGDTILKIFKESNWSEKTKHTSFVPAITKVIVAHRKYHHCNKLTFLGAGVGIPDKLVCADCGRLMEKHISYHCCINSD